MHRNQISNFQELKSREPNTPRWKFELLVNTNKQAIDHIFNTNGCMILQINALGNEKFGFVLWSP